MSKPLSLITVSFFIIFLTVSTTQAAPTITGTPTIDKPQLLEWPLDIPATDPDLSEPTANNINDLHARISKCDDINVVLSTAGNYHMALRDLWYDYFLPANSQYLRNWFYTTSPPISPEQITNLTLTFGNVRLECRPIIAVGPQGLMETLEGLNVLEGDPIPVIKNQGNVILVKKGNPKKIKTIWDLGRKNVKVVTSNPYTEKGSFSNYRDSIYDIALNDPNPPANWTADKLFNAIFNSTDKFNKNADKHSDNVKHRYRTKWLTGKRIHHREVPWSIVYGQADAGLIFYHLALYMVRTFPDKFDIVPLGGTVDFPDPVKGNKQATLYIAKVKAEEGAELNNDQYQAREELVKAYLSTEFDKILYKHGLLRP